MNRSNKCIHELIAGQAESSPLRVALSYAGREVSYRDLNAQANRLAANLRKRGATPGAFVGVCLDLSIDAVVAVLAVLKTGAAYVPLSPQEPFKRIEEIIADTGLSIVVTRLGFRHRISDSDVDVVSVDEEFRLIAAESPEEPGVPVTLDSLAYVSYTSGSTGKPKGILATHRSVTNGLANPPFDPEADEVCALTAPLRFGFSVAAMFLPLALGKRLVIFPERLIGDPERFVDIVETQEVTCVVIVPPMLREILRLNTPLSARLAHIRTLAVSGTALPPELAERASMTLPKAKLINAYASSEVGGAALVWEFRKKPGEEPGRGHPFPNTRVYVLDETMTPVSEGDIGEIHVAAAHLAHGYLGQPALTAERFRPDPFGAQPGGRMYKTGDLGRVLPSGTIEVLGRADDQVKVRGFRVELSEVETVLREHPQVLDAIVTAQAAASEDDVRLTAYAVVGQLDAQSTRVLLKDLRSFVADRLPQYMAPSRYALLSEAFPRTALGKIDRSQLPEPEQDGMNPEYEAPQTPIEIRLSQIWTEALGIDDIGRNDNFLELGGHSLLAAQAISRMREIFGVQLSPQDFLDYPTIAEQARAVESASSPVGPSLAQGGHRQEV